MQAHSASGATHAPASVPAAGNSAAGAPAAGAPIIAAESLPDAASVLAPDALRSGVSWDAVFAGATSAAAFSLVFILLGSGLGFAAVSPWTDNKGVALGVSAILWLVFTQLAAAALGGFLAGRLRMKWARIHDGDVYFRDTAHGLLSWAVSTLVMAVFSGGVIGTMAGGAADTGAVTAAAAHKAAATAMAPNGDAAHSPDYLIDVMLRSERTGPADAALRQEAMRVLASGVARGRLAVSDRAWLTRRIADRTGLDREDAGKRVDDAFAGFAAAAEKAKVATREALENTRKAAASTALWLTAALLLGAFVASWCATIGGRLRDGLAATGGR
ncbi:hypothetical protein ACSUZJ_05160 [Telluria sp. B2]